MCLNWEKYTRLFQVTVRFIRSPLITTSGRESESEEGRQPNANTNVINYIVCESRHVDFISCGVLFKSEDDNSHDPLQL